MIKVRKILFGSIERKLVVFNILFIMLIFTGVAGSYYLYTNSMLPFYVDEGSFIVDHIKHEILFELETSDKKTSEKSIDVLTKSGFRKRINNFFSGISRIGNIHSILLLDSEYNKIMQSGDADLTELYSDIGRSSYYAGIDLGGKRISLNGRSFLLFCESFELKEVDDFPKVYIVLFLSLQEFKLKTQNILWFSLGLAFLLCILILQMQYYIARYLFKPIHLLQKGTRLISNGNYNVQIDIEGANELSQLGASFNYMSKKLKANIREISEQKEYIENIIATMPCAMAVINYSYTDKHLSYIVFCNERWQKIDVEKDFLPNFLENISQEIDEILKGTESRLSYEKKFKDVFYLIRMSRLHLDIGQNLVLLLVDDISIRKKEEENLKTYREYLEKEIEKRTLSIQQTNEKLKAEITNRKNEEEARLKVERELNQTQKLESIGTLAAGIAHEINTPIQFISDNMEFIKMSVESMLKLILCYEQFVKDFQAGKESFEIDEISNLKESIGFSFLKEEISLAIVQSQEGLDRVTTIVRAMKDFSHSGVEDEKTMADINQAIDSTITIARNEWKYVADLKVDLDPSLPLIPCFIGDIKQVILNLIVNSSHAIREVFDEKNAGKGLIMITTSQQKDNILITVSDTGAGIPENIRKRVFDHFFTTKEVGKGTGQGLSMAYGAIVEKHQGSIRFESEVGKGTTFFVSLPLNP